MILSALQATATPAAAAGWAVPVQGRCRQNYEKNWKKFWVKKKYFEAARVLNGENLTLVLNIWIESYKWANSKFWRVRAVLEKHSGQIWLIRKFPCEQEPRRQTDLWAKVMMFRSWFVDKSSSSTTKQRTINWFGKTSNDDRCPSSQWERFDFED